MPARAAPAAGAEQARWLGRAGLAEVVKGLQVLSELRPLPTKERELYDNARHLLVSEVAAALGAAEVNAEAAIDIVRFPPGRAVFGGCWPGVTAASAATVT